MGKNKHNKRNTLADASKRNLPTAVMQNESNDFVANEQQETAMPTILEEHDPQPIEQDTMEPDLAEQDVMEPEPKMQPLTKPKVPKQERSWQSFSVICDKELVRKIKAIAHKEHLHINDVVQTIYRMAIDNYERTHGPIDDVHNKRTAADVLFANADNIQVHI